MLHNNLCINNEIYHYDLTLLKTTKQNNLHEQNTNQLYWYGFNAVWKTVPYFVRLHYNGQFEAIIY